MPVDPGRLDRRVTVQSRTTTRDSQGSAIVTWADDQTIWAQKVQTGGSETRRAGAVRADTSLVLRIRYRSTLTTQHRLYFDGKYFDVTEITEEGRRESQLVQARTTEGGAT